MSFPFLEGDPPVLPLMAIDDMTLRQSLCLGFLTSLFRVLYQKFSTPKPQIFEVFSLGTRQSFFLFRTRRLSKGFREGSCDRFAGDENGSMSHGLVASPSQYAAPMELGPRGLYP